MRAAVVFTVPKRAIANRKAGRLFASYCLCCLFLLLAWRAQAQDQPEIYFAGVSYLGEEKYVEKHYPVVYRLNKPPKGQQAKLDKVFFTLLKNTPSLPFTFLQTKKESYTDGQAIAMTLAIERESFAAEYLNDSVNLFTEVNAQILFFDFSTMHLIKNIPVAIARNNVIALTADATTAARETIEDIYLPPPGARSLFDIALKELQSTQITPENALRFQIDNVSFSDRSKAVLLPEQSTAFLAQVFGQYFTAQLNHHTGLNMIPYIHGYAIRKKMSARMADNSVYQLTLPEPDFVFSLEIDKLVKAPQPEKSKTIYGTKVRLVCREVMTQDVLFDEYMFYAVNKMVLKSHIKVDDWSGYEDAMEMMLLSIAEQLAEPERDWFEDHSTNKKAAYKQLKKWSKQFYEK